MSENFLKQRFNYQDTTPKRVYLQQQYTQPIINPTTTIFHTPDRIIKTPYRNQNPNQSYNDMSDYSKRNYQQPPTYQSSQISIQQEFINTSKMIDQMKRPEQPFNYDCNNLVKKIEDMQLNLKEKDKKNREFAQPYHENIVQQTTDRFTKQQLEEKEKMVRQNENKKFKEMVIQQQQKLTQELEECKRKIHLQDTKIQDQERLNKQLKAQLKDKQQEIQHVKNTHISQTKMEEYFQEQVKEFRKTYSLLASQNDELQEENNQLKMLILQADNYSSVSRSVLSKKNSEQEFQVSQPENIKELVDSFIFGTSNQLLNLSNDPTIQNAFQQFKGIINGFQLKTTPDYELVNSGNFMKLKKQSEEVISVPELNQKAELIMREIKYRIDQLAQIKENDPQRKQLQNQIDKLQKEYDGIQILVTEQSDYLDKNQNIHRNSIISFDQNFDGEEHI